MSETPFTNTKTCNSVLDAQAKQQETQSGVQLTAITRAAAPTKLYYANAAYGVNLCHSTYCQLIDDGYVAS